MTAAEITQYLTELNNELRLMDIKGEVSLYGGAVMCLVYNARTATNDVDAIFAPAAEIRVATDRIASRHDLPTDWLNDGVKGYLVDHESRIFIDLPNLKVFVPEPDYLLAMKALSARADSWDASDIMYLVDVVGLKTADEVLNLVEKYYPRDQIKPVTQYFIQALFEQ